MVFGVDIYSQNEIEDIAKDAYFQLRLIDKFVQPEVDEVDRQIQETVERLKANASQILDGRRQVADLTEGVRALPAISEKIRGFKASENGDEDQAIGRAHELHALRRQEIQYLETIRALYSDGIEALVSVEDELASVLEETRVSDFRESPNAELHKRVDGAAQKAVDAVSRHLESAKAVLDVSKTELQEFHDKVAALHRLQDQRYRELLDQHEQERTKGAERTRLEQRHAELKKHEKTLKAKQKRLAKLSKERTAVLAQLSEHRDRRYALRVGVAERLNSHLSPMIRVHVEQFGNMDAYQMLLGQSMKGSRLRYAPIVDRASDRIPPAEFVALIQNEDQETLQRELDLDADRVTRLIIQLKDKPEIFELETVELYDKPVIELKDGDDYKDAASLSTGQKCTTILPILLIQSERPLLIDQPEDNLDNAFVFETVVQSIREVEGSRQLIFVTHNPNIPVLGNAARVFVLQSTGRSASLANAGSVDDVAPEIMTILEGGRTAFEARRKRYGKPVPDPNAA